MKNIFKKIVVYIITLEAKLVLKKYKPKIVAVTGNIGKTSSKDAIYTVLSSMSFVRKSEKSFNSEVGVPLTILGLPNAWNSVSGWFKNIIDGFSLIIMKNHYPKWLVLEVGADRPGDIESISKWLKPDAVVMTHLPDVPVHVEFFNNTEEVVKEKSYLVKALKDEGVFVVNSDDKKAFGMKALVSDLPAGKAGKKVFTYGYTTGSSVVASDENIIYKDNKPTGITFRVDYSGNSIPVELKGVIGKQHIYPILSALAIGISQGLNIVKMETALVMHEPAPGRMRLIDGINNSTIIDDSYNASPTATAEALNTLKSVSTTGRKIAVLGDMLELGEHSYDEHMKIGKLVAETADILITVGVRSKYIAQGANEAKMKKRDIFSFNDSVKAGEKLEKIIGENDTVLVKGSQSIRAEKAVEKVMAEPDRKYKLLVRQEEEWKKR
ncbi:UDP-N-acetylmuramoyl-tripeptide--D-alanyl-D-alanine ligase [bacterium]|nr:UDP-N-acetylmuramoyl-tripeptide--D-alanyl-D-alanine ligase [bacterium]MBT4894632.1 UDP-N-acetylmuramoyl-tripeptide--D-alanyl-D-alanine ligase [bacterium]